MSNATPVHSTYFWSYQITFSNKASIADVPPAIVGMLQDQYNHGFDTMRECFDMAGQLVWCCMRQHINIDVTQMTIELKGKGWEASMYIKVRVQ